MCGIASLSRERTVSEAAQSLFYARDVPVANSYDVVVCGGGPAGCAAALAARRSGLSVLLVEG